MGICQLLILGIADHAAVNETVACARRPVRGLINAVLRRAIAARKALSAQVEDLPPPVRYSHPDWLYNRWKKQFGRENAVSLLNWNNRPAPVILRGNPIATSAGDAAHGSSLPGLAVELGIGLAETSHPGYYALDAPLPADWIQRGLVYVQDPSTRHAVELLAPRPGETVLDACAAPGGKAFLIASAMNNEGELLCTDSNQRRLPRLAGNLQRLHVSMAAIAAFDWTTEAPPGWHRRFDAILLDVPCSNTGVLRRRVDARWRLQPRQIGALAEIQGLILANALPCLKPGGRLVYSTCSLEPEENNLQVEALIASHPGLVLRETHQSLPFRDGADGAYAALLVARA